MKGLILAAGRGRRLMPLSRTIPKALIPVKGRPLILYQLLRFKKAGIKDIGIVIRKKDYQKFRRRVNIKGLKIKYIFQKRQKGTLKAVECAEKFIGNKRFLLCWCDFLSPFEFKKLIKRHHKFKDCATVLINKERDASSSSQVEFNKLYITRIVEKPKKRFSSWVACGAMVLDGEIFNIFSKIKPSQQGEYHIADALQYLIDNGKKINYVKLDSWRINVNTFRDLKMAEAKVSKLENLWV
jgi:glucose-1-phosphate thymidylyltransferase